MTGEGWVALLTGLAGGIIWIVKKIQEVAVWKKDVQVKLENMSEKNLQQDKHMESIDKRDENNDEKFERILEELGNLKVTKEQVSQLKLQHQELRGDYRNLNTKVDKQFSLLNEIKSTLSQLKK